MKKGCTALPVLLSPAHPACNCPTSPRSLVAVCTRYARLSEGRTSHPKAHSPERRGPHGQRCPHGQRSSRPEVLTARLSEVLTAAKGAWYLRVEVRVSGPRGVVHAPCLCHPGDGSVCECFHAPSSSVTTVLGVSTMHSCACIDMSFELNVQTLRIAFYIR